MNTLKIRLTNLALATAAFAALGMGAMNATSASAVPMDEPWGEPPSCSNETGTCTSIEDMLAYECSFEDTEGMAWCETELPDLLEMQRDPGQSFQVELPAPPPPVKGRASR